MIELKIDRRQLLKIGLSTGLVASLPLGCLGLREDDLASLAAYASDSEFPIDPGRTGELSQQGFDVLAGLCEFVDAGWELGSELGPYLERLRGDLNSKAAEHPSYLTEYERAVDLAELLSRTSESPDQAWTALLFAEIDSDVPEHSRLGRARRFVFGEIVTHQVALAGGFKSFGLINYTGHFGGPFLEEGSYRRGSS